MFHASAIRQNRELVMCQQGAAEADYMRERDREIRKRGYEAFGNGEPRKTEEPGGGKIEFDSDTYHFNLGWETAQDGRAAW